MRTLASLAMYVSVYYLIFRDIRSIALLVLVILIHESGHYIAMRAYGYKNVRMLFVPMLGAYVSGQPMQVDPAKRIIVLFAGPLPGLVIGVMCAMIYSFQGQYIFYLLALMFIILNLFNLIPISPMDGGQILASLFARRQQWLQTAFIALAIIAVIYSMVVYRQYILSILLLLLASRLFRLWMPRQAADKELQKEAEPLAEPSRNEKWIFLAIWILAIIVPSMALYRII